MPQCEPLNTCHMSRITLGASKNVKFRLSRNSMKFDVVARFREMILTVKPVSSSEIKKFISDFDQNYHFTLLSKIRIFPRFHILPPLKEFRPEFPHTYASLTCIWNLTQLQDRVGHDNSPKVTVIDNPMGCQLIHVENDIRTRQCLPPEGPP